MDNRLITHIKDKYNVSALKSITISDNEYNIPDSLYCRMKRPIVYDFNSIDGFDMTHEWLTRVYCGNLHDKETDIKFTKKITVTVHGDTNLKCDDKEAKYIISVIKLKKNSKWQHEKVEREAYRIISRLMYGDEDPTDPKKIPIHTEAMNIQYTIGCLNIFQDDPDDYGYITYYFGLAFKPSIYVEKYNFKEKLLVDNG